RISEAAPEPPPSCARARRRAPAARGRHRTRRGACGPRPRSTARRFSAEAAACAARSARCVRARSPPRTAPSPLAAADTLSPGETPGRFPARLRWRATLLPSRLVLRPLRFPPLYRQCLCLTQRSHLPAEDRSEKFRWKDNYSPSAEGFGPKVARVATSLPSMLVLRHLRFIPFYRQCLVGS